MINIDNEIRRLRDIMPASGRMLHKIISKPQQPMVMDIPFPLPWKGNKRPIYINFDLWFRLSKAQRDLLLLRGVSYSLEVKWFKPDIYQGITLAAFVGLISELVQQDIVGIIIAGGLTAIAARQIWRSNYSVQKELDADEAAIKVALRRGYTEVEAAENLLSAIEAVAAIERRSSLDFSELIRSQNLKAIAHISPVGVPEQMKRQ